ncbi:NGG1p interacting factor NIF3 [Rhodocytophaga rosea]|uniref:NGG1p interacting factor NIF3 n=1 Tax=Rhodocytophaga rosea TaxID=2704465 RepID=A0A6C0GMS6_9BACT|nr:Nif3-like dinuclear metal center hexameric protein [Rhodocytophaga rosea]QHT69336.1 NGG1p interacting factor NIF3 [Rhodocytophaga rosea]
MPLLSEISYFLDEYLQVGQYPKEKHGIWRPTIAPVRKMGLVLEPWPQIYDWTAQHELDALYVHRPWKLNLEQLPENTGVLSYHLPFDEKLTLGYNPLLAAQLQMTDIEPIGQKENRPIGMTGIISTVRVEWFISQLETLFGPPEQIYKGVTGEINKVAVMGAMTESLVWEVARKNVQLYLTGQFRKPAVSAVAQTGLHIIAAGHLQSERYGLHVLANLLTSKWPDIQVVPASHHK